MGSRLPDELWRRIIEIGVQSKVLSYRSLCSLSIVSRRLRRLAADDSLWASLVLSDFPSPAPAVHESRFSSSSEESKHKGMYKLRFEKEREQKRLAHRRAVLRIESEIAERMRKIRELENRVSEEKEKMNSTVSELINLQKIRQASVALNVWQPEIVRGRQKLMVEQSNVPVDFRATALEMELKLCKQQIAGFDKALRAEKRRLDAVQEQLASVLYHPLNYTEAEFQDCKIKTKKSKDAPQLEGQEGDVKCT